MLQCTVCDPLTSHPLFLIFTRYTRHVQIPCPRKNNTGLIIGLVVGVVAGMPPFFHNSSRPRTEIHFETVILILALAIWYFKRRSHKKNGKSLSAGSRGLDDGSSDRESIVPLVHGGPGEKFGGYNDPYTDKSTHV